MTRPASVRIRTGARLHCGLFSDDRPNGRRFQGLGLMISPPGYQLELTYSQSSSAIAFPDASQFSASLREELEKRFYRFVSQLETAFSNEEFESVSLTVLDAIPLHAGLGAGTQFALAVGRGWLELQNLNLATPALAKIVQRSKRSSIGTIGFDLGGLLIDRGVKYSCSQGYSQKIYDIPTEWRIILVTPPHQTGLSGEREQQAFLNMSPLTDKQITSLTNYLTEIENHPADFFVLSEQMRKFGLQVGQTFASIQGGRFAHPAGEQILSLFDELNIRGVAQTSWGPSLFGLVQSEEEAVTAAEFLKAKRSDCKIRICSPLNQGAEISPEF